ncbi:MAG: hypothetical protein IPG30_13560 [Chitinophagaceae bacterium]|nr:hypothetical protein [Chitinophagaceae bacterium]
MGFENGYTANYFPSSVIKGMLAAIGIILITKQIPVALGYDQPILGRRNLKLFFGQDVPANLDGFQTSCNCRYSANSNSFNCNFCMLHYAFAHKLKTIPAPLLVVVYVGIVINLILVVQHQGFL